MPKYTKPLPLDEYDKLTLEERAAYISDMVDLLPAPAAPKPSDHKPKTSKAPKPHVATH